MPGPPGERAVARSSGQDGERIVRHRKKPVGRTDSERAVQRDGAGYLEPSVARAGSRAAEASIEQRAGRGSITAVRRQDTIANLHSAVIVEGYVGGDGRRSRVEGLTEGSRVVEP